VNDKQMLESCISDCNNSLSEIRKLSQSVSSPMVKDELTHASEAINQCIRHCQHAWNSL
jgi:hypothetical protein